MASATVPVHRLSVEDVHRMVAAGVLGEDDRIELVDGILVEMTPIGAEHDGALAWLTRRLAGAGTGDWEARIQSTLLIPGGYLLPDLALVELLPRSRQPDTALLVIEVAQTSQARDAEKAADYARAGVPDYWLVDLPGRAVTVHRSPAQGGYAGVERLGDGATLTPLAVGAPTVDVSELLGRETD